MTRAGCRPVSLGAGRSTGWPSSALVVYILVAVYDWRLPNRDGTSFGPVWAVLARGDRSSSCVAAGAAGSRSTPSPRRRPVAALLTDLVQFNGQVLRDLGIYLRAGEHFAAGVPVYLQTILTEAPVDKTTYPFLYPPPTLPFLAVLASLPRTLVEVGWVVGSARSRSGACA